MFSHWPKNVNPFPMAGTFADEDNLFIEFLTSARPNGGAALQEKSNAEPLVREIPLEQIGMYRFSSHEVLLGEWDKVWRQYQVQQAARLRENVQVVFHSVHADEVRAVSGIVTDFDDDQRFITLSPGRHRVPIHAISKINLPDKKEVGTPTP